MNIFSEEFSFCVCSKEVGVNSHFLQVDSPFVEKWIYPFHVDLAP